MRARLPQRSSSPQNGQPAQVNSEGGSDNDPCCPEGAGAAYGTPFGLPADVLAGAGHLGMDAGYGPWPSLLTWCLDPSIDTLLVTT